MNETKKGLVRSVSKSTNFSQRNCRNVLHSLIYEIILRCRDGKEVYLKGLGTFRACPTKRKPYDFPKKKLMNMQIKKYLRLAADWEFMDKMRV